MSFFPYLTVINCKDSINFYTKAFGFILTDKSFSKTEEIIHAEMKFGDSEIMFCNEGSYNTTAKTPKTYNVEASLNLYIHCENVDHLYEKAKAAGAKILKNPKMLSGEIDGVKLKT